MKIQSLTNRVGSLYRFGKIYFQSSNIILTEYPKSGGTWVGNMIADYSGLPFPRNRMPNLQPCILHGHYRSFPTIKNVFVILRDGRDIMVSFYFHSYFGNELYNAPLVKKMRKELPFNDYNDVENNLPLFIEYKFNRKKPPHFAWNEFVESWIDKDVAFVRYEKLLKDPVQELGTSIEKVFNNPVNYHILKRIVDKYSFDQIAKREPGQERRNSFMRKGIAGDWENYFNKESREIFNYYAGQQLIKLGYEEDLSWI